MKKLFTASLLVFISTFIFSQDLPHYMTPEELKIWETYEHPGNSEFDYPPPMPVRTIAEWEEMDGVAITWTSYTAILRQIVDYAQDEGLVYIICSDSNTVKSYLTSGGVPLVNLKFIYAPFNSVWIRDYGPWSVYSNTADSMMFVDWKYNRPRPSDDQIPVYIANMMNTPLYQAITPPYDFIATGGNFMTDGHGTGFSSKLVLNENPTKTEAQIDTIAKKFMGLSRYIKMTNLPYDGIHHIDMHMKLLDEETLLVGQYPAGIADGPQIEANLQYILNNFQTCYGRPFKVVRIPMPPDALGRYPNTGGDYRTFTNSVIINKTVIVPTYELQYDTTALRIYREAMPGYRVVGINCNQTITALGAIHCIVKELGSKEPVYISHAKINFKPEGDPVEVKAYIKTRTGVANSYLHWSTDTTSGFNTVPLVHAAADTFNAFIPSHVQGTKVYYYISASSVSGRTNSRPMTAPQGLYEFIFTEPVPVEMISFNASSENNAVTLNWVTASELNNKGFAVERKTNGSSWESITFIDGYGTTTEKRYYSYNDNNLKAGKYSYRLIQTDYDGTQSISGTVSADVMIRQFSLAQNYPNPFNPSTRIKYSLPDNNGNSYKVTLKLYDILGNEVSLVIDTEQGAGEYEADIDMRNMAGGVYFYLLKAGEYQSVNKMILQK